MIGNQDSAGKQNPAWRAFWVKIRELDARETGSRKEAREDNHLEPTSAADRPAGLTPIASLKGKGTPETENQRTEN